MTGWSLPTALTVGGREYRINADYRDILEVISCLQDEDTLAGQYVALALFYEGFEDMPREDHPQAMEELARFIGVETEMTRREDVSLHDASADTVRAKKASDLKNRTALANAVPGGVVVSIHQNSLPDVPSVCGAQVFYSAAEGSQELAEAVQSALNAALNPKPKEPKQAGSSVYLLQHAKSPTILVECGFLSNPQETVRLNTPAYQTELALTILSAVLAHLR